MDEMDYETMVYENLEEIRARNFVKMKEGHVDLEPKEKVDSEMTLTGTSALRKAFDAKKFHGKVAKQGRVNTEPPKETYAEMITRLQETYETEPEGADEDDN